MTDARRTDGMLDHPPLPELATVVCAREPPKSSMRGADAARTALTASRRLTAVEVASDAFEDRGAKRMGSIDFTGPTAAALAPAGAASTPREAPKQKTITRRATENAPRRRATDQVGAATVEWTAAGVPAPAGLAH